MTIQVNLKNRTNENILDIEDVDTNDLIDELRTREQIFDYIFSSDDLESILVDKNDLSAIEKQNFIKSFFDLKSYDNVESVIREVNELFKY